MPPKEEITSAIVDEIKSITDSLQSREEKVRAAANILFFSHGIYPSAGKVYTCIKYGGTAEIQRDLLNFWQDIRSKAKVRIDAPIPDDLKEGISEYMSQLWSKASELAAVAFSEDRKGFEESVQQKQKEIEDFERKLKSAHEAHEDLEKTMDAQLATHEALKVERIKQDTHIEGLNAKISDWQILAKAAEDARDQAQKQFAEELALMREQSKAEIARYDADLKHFKLEAYTARQAEKEANDKLTKESVKTQEALKSAQGALKAIQEGHQKSESEWIARIGALQAQVKVMEAALVKDAKVVPTKKRLMTAKVSRFAGKKSLR